MWPFKKKNQPPPFHIAWMDALTTFKIKLNEQEANHFRRICEQEYRRPEDQARMIISDFIKDYNGT